MSKKPLPSQKEEFFTEHLPYEITLMKESYDLLLDPRPWAMHNALIVAFLNSSRLLIEFFKNKPSCDFDPRMFAKSTFQLNTQCVPNGTLSDINAQIMHLSAKRTKVSADKLDETFWKRTRDGLATEITRFERALHPDFQPKWPLKPDQVISVSPVRSQSSFPTFERIVTGPATISP